MFTGLVFIILKWYDETGLFLKFFLLKSIHKNISLAYNILKEQIHMDFILYGIFLFIFTVGFVEILNITERWVVRSKRPPSSIIIIPLCGHMEEIEMLAREFKAKFRRNDRANLLLLDMGMDKETRDICEIFCADNRNFILCYYHQIDNILRKNVAVR